MSNPLVLNFLDIFFWLQDRNLLIIFAIMMCSTFISLLIIGVSHGFSLNYGSIYRKGSSSSLCVGYSKAMEMSAAEGSVNKEYSFVNTDMRKYAMKLHSPMQAPKEGW